MAIIMLAIGSLLAAVGLYAIVSGYPMIEIERGWASVIAGSVLLSGGLVIVALGFVLRALARLRVPMPMVAQPSAAPGPAVAEPSFPSFAAEPSPVGVTLPALAVAAPAAAAVLAAGYGARHGALQTVATSEPEPPAPAPVVPAWPAPTPGEAEPATPPPAETGDEHAFSDYDHEAEPEVHAKPAEAPHVEDSEAHAPPLRDDHPKFADHSAETEEFDFPEFAHEPETHPVESAHDPSHDAAPHTTDMDEPHPVIEPAEHVHEPADTAADVEPAADAPATAPESPPANLAVIGRYDSEGTSYVMYSDGSIEAQSEAGIYRFTSMAELKAFIEG